MVPACIVRLGLPGTICLLRSGERGRAQRGATKEVKERQYYHRSGVEQQRRLEKGGFLF
jgi:hypothetical protein